MGAIWVTIRDDMASQARIDTLAGKAEVAGPLYEYAVIADDLTGALDTGVQFFKKGLSTCLSWDPFYGQPDAMVILVNTNSRNLEGDKAYRRLFRIGRAVRAKRFYKKIDSTMRGNIGKESLALMEAKGLDKALIAPAIPSLGRTVEKGVLKIEGTPLLQTPYAKDPFHPVFSSRIRRLIEKQTGLSAGLIGLGEIRRGPGSLARRIKASRHRFIVLDTKEEIDLCLIASACEELADKVLVCGSSGLASALPQVRPRQETERPGIKASGKAILVVAASRNPKTALQLRFAQRMETCTVVEPRVDRLVQHRSLRDEVGKISRKIIEACSSTPCILLTTTFQPHIRGKEYEVARGLGLIVSSVWRSLELKGLVLTGGDLAFEVCSLLGTSGLSIRDELLAGIPLSFPVDGPQKGLALVTKAGGFGEEDALCRIIRYLEGSI